MLCKTPRKFSKARFSSWRVDFTFVLCSSSSPSHGLKNADSYLYWCTHVQEISSQALQRSQGIDLLTGIGQLYFPQFESSVHARLPFKLPTSAALSLENASFATCWAIMYQRNLVPIDHCIYINGVIIIYLEVSSNCMHCCSACSESQVAISHRYFVDKITGKFIFFLPITAKFISLVHIIGHYMAFWIRFALYCTVDDVCALLQHVLYP